MKLHQDDFQPILRAMGRSILFFLPLVAFLSLMPSRSLHAQESKQKASLNDDKIVATIEELTIRRQSVLNQMPKFKAKLQPSAAQLASFEEAVLEKQIQQRIAFYYLKSHDQIIGESEVKIQLEALEAELAKYEKTIDSFLEERKQNREELEFAMKMRESWKRYLKNKLTDENLELHYSRNRRQFDGTDVRVAHIFFKTADDASVEQQIAKATEVRAMLANQSQEAATLSWSDAVKQHSQGSLKNDGEVGTVVLQRTMAPEFIAVAKEMNTGDLSEPVVTGSGVHIIKCLEVIPGHVGWRDAKKAVTKDAGTFLFKTIVERHREKLKITIH